MATDGQLADARQRMQEFAEEATPEQILQLITESVQMFPDLAWAFVNVSGKARMLGGTRQEVILMIQETMSDG